MKIDLDLTMLEVATGVKKTVKMKLLDPCDRCSGSGAEPGTKPQRCATCAGQGEVRRAQQSFFGQFVSVAPCPTCRGTGRVFTPETIVRRVERSIRRIAVEGRRDSLVVRLHPEVAMHVLEQEPDFIRKLEKAVAFSLEVRDDPLLGPDEFRLVVKGAGRDVTQQYAVA